MGGVFFSLSERQRKERHKTSHICSGGDGLMPKHSWLDGPQGQPVAGLGVMLGLQLGAGGGGGATQGTRGSPLHKTDKGASSGKSGSYRAPGKPPVG